MTVFWDQSREMIVDFLAKGSIITGTYYALLLKQFRKSIKTERRGMLTRGGLTPAGQLSSSPLVFCADRKTNNCANIGLSPTIGSRSGEIFNERPSYILLNFNKIMQILLILKPSFQSLTCGIVLI